MFGTIRERAERVLRNEPARAGIEPPLLEAIEREWIARRVRRDTGTCFLDSPRTLAAKMRIVVGCASLPNFSGEVSLPGLVCYRVRCNRQEQGLYIAHGIAHNILMADGCEHTEADAWLLTGELILPSRLVLADLMPQLHAPDWFVRAWLRARWRIRADLSVAQVA